MEEKNNFSVIITALVIVIIVAFVVSYFKAKNYHPEDTLVLDETYELKDIIIKSNAANINIKNTDEEIIKVKIYGDESRTTVEDYDKLSIESNIKTFKFLSFNKAATIEIYLPKDYDNKIKIEDDYGNLTIDSFIDSTFDIELDAGKVKMKEVSNLKLDVNAADVEISKINKKFDIEVDAGNVEIGEIDIEEDSSIEIDAGNVEIGKTNKIAIDTETDVVEVKINNNYSDSKVHLNISMDIGNISIDN